MTPSNTPPTHTNRSSDLQKEESYTAMGPNSDLESIGAHCQFPYCNVLDFLPFRCDSCRKTYCLEHRSETAHKCPKAGEWARIRNRGSQGQRDVTGKGGPMVNTGKPTVITGTQCSDPRCKTLIDTLTNPKVHCSTCRRDYCLKHRLVEDHNCKNLQPLGLATGVAGRGLGNRIIPITSPKAQADKARLAFSKLRSWGKEKATPTPKPPAPNSNAARIVDLNNLKKNAKGLDSIPAEKRIYLHVEAEAATTTSKLPQADLFFNSDWSVGRVLDEAAKRLQVENINNRVQGEDGRLRVYFVEGGRLLDFNEKVGTGVRSGNTVVLLRGVGPAVPHLIEV